MYYEDESGRLGILGGFALGVAFGAGVGLLLRGGRRGHAGDAVARARRLHGPTGRGASAARGGAAARVARKRFRL